MLSRRGFLVLTGSALVAGCGPPSSPDESNVVTWGRQGRRSGEFLRPRAIGVHQGEVYVIDKSGRVQVFDEGGAFRRQWSVPESENGTPTAIAFHQNGRVLIPDTHYSRILEYSPDGELLEQWGHFGNSEDAFIYPTGAAIGPDGTYYLSEYGVGAERVHVFDGSHGFLRQWGSHGEGTGQFNRAMAIGMNPAGELFVADTANHRVQCFDTSGTHLRTIGSPGTDPGQLKFPHDLAVGPDGCIYCAEYGAHRISRFAPGGEFLRCYGSAGRAPGQFDAPRGVAVSASNRIFVADTDNHRIQAFDAERPA